MSLIEAPEVEVISTRYRTKRRDKGGVWTSHHARPLDTLRNVRIEVARVYRAMANGKLSSSEGARFTFVLRELRCCLESEALEAENAARKAPAVPSEVNVSIITVPSGCFVSAERAEQIANGEFLRQVEHETVSLDDYTRNAAAQQAEAEREINAAVNTVVFAEPIEPPAPSPTPEVIVAPRPEPDQCDIDRSLGFELSRPR